MLENEEIDTKDMSDLESEKSAAKRNITRKAELRTQKLNTIKEKEKKMKCLIIILTKMKILMKIVCYIVRLLIQFLQCLMQNIMFQL